MHNFTFGGGFGEQVQLALLVHVIIFLVRSEMKGKRKSRDGGLNLGDLIRRSFTIADPDEVLRQHMALQNPPPEQPQPSTQLQSQPVAHIQIQIQPLCNNKAANIVIQTPTLNRHTIIGPSQAVGQPSSNIAGKSGTCSNASKKKSGRGPSLMLAIWGTSKLFEANVEEDNTTFPETAKDDIIEEHFLLNKENDEALLQSSNARLDDTQWQALLKSQGLPASQLDVFSKSPIGKDGVILDEETMTILLLIKDHITQVPEGDRTEAIKEQIFKEFMGENNHGYTRCVGRTSYVLQKIIQIVKEELRADEQEEFKERLKRESRDEACTADLMNETFTQGRTEQSTRVQFFLTVLINLRQLIFLEGKKMNTLSP
ncbi:hypothetical protein M9H77_12611 [Catharanthus roseus]|uniref:Uncharacterized protein n=1 Tax=Catharanthus roseus TaxID=4058 RepID=A0ACC0BHX0_CATRO|nr:hypothetical protein M9H77_12611 [Catharanthus roseus]